MLTLRRRAYPGHLVHVKTSTRYFRSDSACLRYIYPRDRCKKTLAAAQSAYTCACLHSAGGTKHHRHATFLFIQHASTSCWPTHSCVSARERPLPLKRLRQDPRPSFVLVASCHSSQHTASITAAWGLTTKARLPFSVTEEWPGACIHSTAVSPESG